MTTITFLGSGGDTHVITKCIRASGGILIQYEDVQLHIDPGPNTLHAAKNAEVNLRATTAVICTSPKISHCNDLNAVISAMTLNGTDIKGVVVGTKTILEGNELNVPFLQPFFKNCVERIIQVEPGKKMGVENVDITFCEANDYCDTVGMKIFMPDVVIGYTSDTSYSEKIASQYEGCDIIIMNVQNPFGMHAKDKMSSEDAVKFIKHISPKLAVITHFGKDMIDQDPMMEARRIHAATGCQVMAAGDGQAISPVSYSAKGNQKRLKQFE